MLCEFQLKRAWNPGDVISSVVTIKTTHLHMIPFIVVQVILEGTHSNGTH